jgi:prepilin-type processing-associated H-X9-DG protein
MRHLIFALAAFFISIDLAYADPCERQTFEGSSFTVCAFDSRHDELRLAWTDRKGTALRGFAALDSALGPARSRVRFAMNAGMYEADGKPLGLYVENGAMRRPLNIRSGGGNFYLKPNGVFLLRRDGTLRIESSDAVTDEPAAPLFATQSGPMLVIAGDFNPNIAADGPSLNIRNGVGVRDARTAFFAISEEPVSFGRLARLFRDQLGCPNALYFDGHVSSAWIPDESRMDQGAPLGPMVVVLDRR